MRHAFRSLGVHVTELDESDPRRLTEALGHLTEKVDLVYERYALGDSPAATFAGERSLPYVLEVNAPLEEEAARWRPESVDTVGSAAHAVVSTESFPSADLVLAVSTQVAEYAVARGARPERVRVAPNAVDPERFHPGLRETALRNDLIPTDRFVLGLHGRLRPWHQFERLCSALAYLHEGARPVHLLTVGYGEYEAVADSFGIQDLHTHIAWCDHDDVGRYVALYDALALSYQESSECYFSPLKLAEAMACGVVPIVPALGDLQSAVQDGDSGIVYDPTQGLGLERAIERVMNDPAWARELGKRAASVACSSTWEQIASDVLEFCATLP